MVRERSTGRHAGSQLEHMLRLCAATRVERSPEDLIRFVAGPDGVVVPDLARRLPGRGVWVTADRASVQHAVAKQAFAKSLKRKVEAAADLADLVENLLLRRVCDALSLANKAGGIVTGFEKVDRGLADGGISGLVHGSDAASDGRQKLDRKFLAIHGPGAASRIVAVLTVDQMSLAMGRPNVVHAGLNTGGASDRFLAEAGRLKRYRSGIAHHSASFDAVEVLTETANLDP
ncbi:MAG: RNA-binding protein [Hyphomicrobiaceae bacterium]